MSRRPDESAALRALQQSLTEEGGGHPAEELLLTYVDKRSSLAAEVAESIGAHLAECASCRDEVGVLGTTTIWPSRVTTASQVAAAASVWRRVVAGWSGSRWRPVLALAVLVVMMVPTLRLIGQDRALRLETVDQPNDVAMTAKHEPRTPSTERARETPSAPEEASQSLPVTPPPPPAALADAAPNAAPSLRADDSLVDQRHMWAARESESRSRNGFAGQTMVKQRALASPPAVPTFDYVAGGRVSIEPEVAARMMVRIKFVRGMSRSTDMRSSGALTGAATGSVVLAPTVSEVEVVVVAADGRRNSRSVDIRSGQQQPTTSMVDIPLDWLATGENRVEIVTREDRPRSVGAAFVVTLQGPD